MVLYGEPVTWWQSIPLILSNVFILPSVVYAFYIGAYLEASWYTGVAVASTAYHVCDTSVTCFGLPHMVFEIADHILAQTAVTWTLIYFLAFDHPRYRGKHLPEKAMFRVFSLLVHLFLALLDHNNSFLYVYIVIMDAFIVAYKFAYVDAFTFRLEDYRWWYVFFSFLLFGGSLVFYLMLDADAQYWWTHSIWHTVAFVGVFLILLARRHGSFEDILYACEVQGSKVRSTQKKLGRLAAVLGGAAGALSDKIGTPSPYEEPDEDADHDKIVESMESGMATADSDAESVQSSTSETDGYDSALSSSVSSGDDSRKRTVVGRGDFSKGKRHGRRRRRNK